MYNLPSTSALVAKTIRQMGRYAALRWMRNLGISFEDAHTMLCGYPPRIGA